MGEIPTAAVHCSRPSSIIYPPSLLSSPPFSLLSLHDVLSSHFYLLSSPYAVKLFTSAFLPSPSALCPCRIARCHAGSRIDTRPRFLLCFFHSVHRASPGGFCTSALLPFCPSALVPFYPSTAARDPPCFSRCESVFACSPRLGLSPIKPPITEVESITTSQHHTPQHNTTQHHNNLLISPFIPRRPRTPSGKAPLLRPARDSTDDPPWATVAAGPGRSGQCEAFPASQVRGWTRVAGIARGMDEYRHRAIVPSCTRT